jgi:RNA polymerase sigma-70 factor, ECF subfamily
MRDEVDFDELFSETHHRIDAAARQMLRDPHDAADVVQEVYLRAWKALPAFRGDAQPFTWLYAILRNAVRTFVHRRRGELTDDGVIELTEHDPLVHPEGWSDQQQLQQEVADAFADLPVGLQEAAVLSFDGIPSADVAAELGISIGAAKVRVHRARRMLRERVA